MTGELIEREARARRIPFLSLNIDEHFLSLYNNLISGESASFL
jgi:hypothetical protein